MHPDQEAEERQQLHDQDFAGVSYGLHLTPPSPVVRQAKHVQQEDMMHLLQCAFSRIQMFSSGQDIDVLSDEDLRSAIKIFLLDASQFVAGHIRHHLPAWKQWFSVFKSIIRLMQFCSVLSMVFHFILCKFYSKFFNQKRNELIASSALIEWYKLSTARPQVVHGLGVVRNHNGKLRLIWIAGTSTCAFHIHTSSMNNFQMQQSVCSLVTILY